MSELVVWQALHWIGLAVFTAGLTTAVLPVAHRVRQIGGFAVATLGLIGTWMAGYGLMHLLGQELGEPYIQASLFTSLAALFGAVLGALMAHRALPLGLVTFGLLGAIGAMYGRADPMSLGLLGGAAPAVLGVLAAGAGFLLPAAPVTRPANRAAVLRWFAWIARAEGVSLLVLFGLHMPLKYGAGIELDGGVGWIGWVHGVLVFLYMMALGTGVVVARWGLVAGVLGFVASLLPFGTFVFEWWLARREAPEAAATPSSAGAEAG